MDNVTRAKALAEERRAQKAERESREKKEHAAQQQQLHKIRMRLAEALRCWNEVEIKNGIALWDEEHLRLYRKSGENITLLLYIRVKWMSAGRNFYGPGPHVYVLNSNDYEVMANSDTKIILEAIAQYMSELL